MEDGPIVKEFLDDFPEELPGLPPDHVLEFVNGLLPEIASIFIPPYRMASFELRELKVQLQCLTQCVTVGALVLFINKKDDSMRLHIDYHQVN